MSNSKNSMPPFDAPFASTPGRQVERAWSIFPIALFARAFPPGYRSHFSDDKGVSNAGKRSPQIVLHICRMLAICKGGGSSDLNKSGSHTQL